VPEWAVSLLVGLGGGAVAALGAYAAIREKLGRMDERTKAQSNELADHETRIRCLERGLK